CLWRTRPLAVNSSKNQLPGELPLVVGKTRLSSKHCHVARRAAVGTQRTFAAEDTTAGRAFRWLLGRLSAAVELAISQVHLMDCIQKDLVVTFRTHLQNI